MPVANDADLEELEPVEAEAVGPALGELPNTIGVATERSLPYPATVAPPGFEEAKVIVMAGSGLGTIFKPCDGPIQIGRDPDNMLVVEDVGVSRFHAVIERDEEAGVDHVRDLGSKNGTYLEDGQVTDKTELRDGNLIFIGQSTLKYLAKGNREQAYFEDICRATWQDALTMLPNRRHFDDYLEREVARAHRHARGLVLLFADIDHFKHINDTHGHVVGDVVLREFAEVVLGRLRRSEFFARYGGEEFAFILPESSARGAAILAEAVRQRVEEHVFHADDVAVPVTVSVGGAIWDASMKEPRDLVAAADEALYRAKRDGRNRVVF